MSVWVSLVLYLPWYISLLTASKNVKFFFQSWHTRPRHVQDGDLGCVEVESEEGYENRWWKYENEKWILGFALEAFPFPLGLKHCVLTTKQCRADISPRFVIPAFGHWWHRRWIHVTFQGQNVLCRVQKTNSFTFAIQPRSEWWLPPRTTPSATTASSWSTPRERCSSKTGRRSPQIWPTQSELHGFRFICACANTSFGKSLIPWLRDPPQGPVHATYYK